MSLNLIYLIDNDAITKLAQFDLLTEFGTAFNLNTDNTFVLPQFYYVAGLDNSAKALKFFGNQLAADRARDFFNNALKVEVQHISTAQEILDLDVPGIDAGEQILLGYMYLNKNSALHTGDKRALKSIIGLEKQSVLSSFSCRILILEEILKALISRFGFDRISDQVRSCQEADTALSLCFGRSLKSDEPNAIDGLDSYISSARI